ncbi:DUF6223 family protein [Streptomyces poonensis]|uniref:Uncharacterized protein n=1 Tax=Streptomyces poonensis TaxID=68255 RepID=A0A918PLT2_9ACTN|nr:DUF6223 family protein [Streptomyces poonensis]GGZ15524.1 hypothetical protein GCM10010365_39130 [Streptomyces poonensis]GLJ91516.1 hypothetical protein GCM10017589_41230 [Streptomyces poonensis]
MSVRRLLAAAGAAAAAALLGGLGLAAPAAAHVFTQSSEAGAYSLTAARFWATAAALLALAGVVIGRLALARSVRRSGDGGTKGAITALVAGLIAVVGGALDLAVADGGPGTGNGVVAGAAALLLGLIAAVLGWLALARSRRTG